MKRLLKGLQLLQGPGATVQRGDALLDGDQLVAFGPELSTEPEVDQVIDTPARALLAPLLIDPHSHLEDPETGRAETLSSLCQEAKAAGYGTVALLPKAASWRDRPEHLNPLSSAGLDVQLWGSITKAGTGVELAPLGDQLNAGAIGLSDGDTMPPLPLLERVLLLGEADAAPLLVAPRDPALTQAGLVREGVDTLRMGWPPDPVNSELLPLHSLMALAPRAPQLRLMNLSTAAGIALLADAPSPPPASTSWWHLLGDHSSLDPLADGWLVHPSLGGAQDRAALRQGLRDGLLWAAAVHHSPLDHEEHLLPWDQRPAGVAGYQQVLPALWQALVDGEGWRADELWQALSWGGSRFLGLAPEQLQCGGRRWLLFDPDAPHQPRQGSHAANCPLRSSPLKGQVLATGLLEPALWDLD